MLHDDDEGQAISITKADLDLLDRATRVAATIIDAPLDYAEPILPYGHDGTPEGHADWVDRMVDILNGSEFVKHNKLAHHHDGTSCHYVHGRCDLND